MQFDGAISVCAVVTDLTPQKRDEELIRTGGLIQSILEQSPNAVMVCNAARTIIYASKVAHQLFGRNVLGQPIESILVDLHISDKPLRLADILSEDVKDGTTICTEKNGKPLHLLLHYGKLGESGDTIGYVISLTDITSLKQTEQLKDDFIGMVSHELRTPLTVVVGAIHTAMLKGITPGERQDLLRDAGSGAWALGNLLDNLLELSRAQADRLVINPTKIDIAAAVREVIEALRATSQIHHLVFDVRQKLPPVSADEIRVRRILYNLVENAIKYSPRGGQVRIFARRNGDSIVIGVSDQGIGISPEDQAKLFQPFLRLESGQAQTKGLGLGLSVCHHLVEAHRGRIWIQSEPGKGSTFFFSLPMTEKGTVNH
jgi:PAS domain S-box-containing protein